MGFEAEGFDPELSRFLQPSKSDSADEVRGQGEVASDDDPLEAITQFHGFGGDKIIKLGEPVTFSALFEQGKLKRPTQLPPR